MTINFQTAMTWIWYFAAVVKSSATSVYYNTLEPGSYSADDISVITEEIAIQPWGTTVLNCGVR